LGNALRWLEARRSTLTPRGGLQWVCAAVVLGGAILIAAYGSWLAVRSPIWDVLDEGAHYSYVQQIAEHGTLPVLDKTLTSEQVLALAEHVYPRTTKTDPRRIGLGGFSYEAFQPPLYYILAVPAFDLSGNYHSKVRGLRAWDLLLYLCAIALFGRLCRVALAERWWLAWAAGMAVFLLPGMVTRGVLISNLPLELVGVFGAVGELVAAMKRDAPGRLVSGGAVLGLALLTDLFALAVVPLFVVAAAVVLRRRWTARRLLAAGAGVGLAGALVAPWLAFNEAHFGALTAGALARKMQDPIINPAHVHYTLRFFVDGVASTTLWPVLAQEWNTAGRPLLSCVVDVLSVVVIPLAIALALSTRRSLSAGGWIWVLVFCANVAVCGGITVAGQLLSDLPRYVYATLPMLAIGMTQGAVALFRTLRPFVAGIVIACAADVTLLVALRGEVRLL
jgi:hypothetical protein